MHIPSLFFTTSICYVIKLGAVIGECVSCASSLGVGESTLDDSDVCLCPANSVFDSATGLCNLEYSVALYVVYTSINELSILTEAEMSAVMLRLSDASMSAYSGVLSMRTILIEVVGVEKANAIASSAGFSRLIFILQTLMSFHLAQEGILLQITNVVEFFGLFSVWSEINAMSYEDFSAVVLQFRVKNIYII